MVFIMQIKKLISFQDRIREEGKAISARNVRAWNCIIAWFLGVSINYGRTFSNAIGYRIEIDGLTKVNR